MRSLAFARPFAIIVVLLVAADVVLMALFGAHKLGWATTPSLDLGADGGPAEILQYAKLFCAAVAAGLLARWTRQPVYAVLALLFGGLLLDDALMLHEHWGARLAAAGALPSVAGLRPSDLGEVAFLAAWVGPLALAGVLTYRRSSGPARRAARVALGALVVLAGFGVGVDVLHEAVLAVVQIDGLHSAFVLLEEGGEMVALSVLAAGAVALAVATEGGAAMQAVLQRSDASAELA